MRHRAHPPSYGTGLPPTPGAGAPAGEGPHPLCTAGDVRQGWPDMAQRLLTGGAGVIELGCLSVVT